MSPAESFKLALLTAAITLIFNIVFSVIKVRLGLFEERSKLKREHNYQQLTRLYLGLYAIVAQSEYIRYFFNVTGDFNNLPFLEIETRKIDINLSANNSTTIVKKFEVKNGITEYNKKGIQSLILDNAQYASAKMLKLAVAYRYLNSHYTDETLEPSIREKFQTEELITICRIVKLIVEETNQYLKNCNMDYELEELESGILKNGIID